MFLEDISKTTLVGLRILSKFSSFSSHFSNFRLKSFPLATSQDIYHLINEVQYVRT